MQACIGGLAIEEARCLFIDAGGRALAEVAFCDGASDGVALPVRKIAALVELLGADVVILAHNHPSGECAPSAGDISTTRHLSQLLAALSATLFDHVIVSRTGVFSFRGQGLL